jgi:hypothetical protein
MFIQGLSNADRFKNMGYILAFVIYFAYPAVYRSTSILLMIFVAFFIMGQYFVALVYKILFVKGPDGNYSNKQ